MADFPEQDHSNTELKKIYSQISSHCLKNYPFESGGYVKKDFSVHFFDSIKPSCFFYLPNHLFYLDIINNKKDILFAFHSHVSFEDASKEDLKFIKLYNIDSVIYIMNSRKFLSVNTRYEKSYFSWSTESVQKE